MLRRRDGLLLVVGLLAVGCDKKEAKSKKSSDDDDDDDDESSKKKKKKKKKKKDDDDDAAETATAKAPSDPPEVTLGRKAYGLGRNWGYACIFAALDKSDQVSRKMSDMAPLLTALGLDTPVAPTKANGIASIRSSTLSDAIAKKHGDKVAAAYSLGRDLSDLFFGVALGADVGAPLASVAANATKAAVPDAVWKSLHAGAKASPTEASTGALSKAIDAHYLYID